MEDSPKIRPGDTITSSHSGPTLNGTPGDLRSVEELYEMDRESEALAIVDRILQLPTEVVNACERLRFLMSGSGQIEVSAQVKSVSEQGLSLQLQTKLGGAFTRVLMVHRGRCFSAILDRPSERNDANLRRSALENAQILTEVFPEDPLCLTLAAQAYVHCGERKRALDLLAKAIALDPKNETAVSTLRAINAEVNFERLTESAIAKISRFVDSGGEDGEVLKQAVEMLNQSLDIFAHQPKAWAGLAWAMSMVNRRMEALELLRRAQKLDPSDSLVNGLIAEFRKLGWL